jgi:CRP-like cAMP-binding protein
VTEPPVVRVELQRADMTGRISQDAKLVGSALVKTLGSDWQGVLRAGQAKRAVACTVLFQQGDPGETLLFLLSGAVRLFARKATDTVELGVAHAGDVLGEAEVIAPQGRRAMSAVANEVVEFVELPREALFGAGPKTTQALERWLKALHAERLKALDEMTDFLNRW